MYDLNLILLDIKYYIICVFGSSVEARIGKIVIILLFLYTNLRGKKKLSFHCGFSNHISRLNSFSEKKIRA